MSDENATPTPPATATATEPRVPKWGDPISSIPTERQEQLRKLAEEQRAWLAATGADRDPDRSPFARAAEEDHMRMTGAEVFFLAAEAIAAERGIALIDAERQARNGPARLAALHLEGASLFQARLEGASLENVHLEGANLIGAHLKDADLIAAHLEGSDFTEAHLEGTKLFDAYLAGADLQEAFFSTGTYLNHAIIASEYHGAVLVADARWQDVNLAVITQWSEIQMLGDEQAAWELQRRPLPNPDMSWEPLPKEASHAEREKARAMRHGYLLDAWRTAARANRQLASVMRDQGMNDEADRFAYRGQVCQRQVYRYSGQRGRRLGSWLLDATSGYGYHPRRSAFTYLGVVLAFAVAFFLLRASVTPALNPLDALVFSVTSFHGRGFSPGEAVTLHNPLTVLAAGEAILGLLIEITFIATFTQRFFGR